MLLANVGVEMSTAGRGSDLLDFVGPSRFATVLADPPWQFVNRTGKIAPEHRRLSRYGTIILKEIMELPVSNIAKPTAHLYLVGAKRSVARRPGGDEGLGLHLQIQSGVAQGPKGWGIGRPRRRLLFPQRHGTHSIRSTRNERAHTSCRSKPSKPTGYT